MIGHVRGKLVHAEDGKWIVSTGEGFGVGYEIYVGLSMAGMPGELCELFVHTNVREGAIDLFGFKTAWERRTFLRLLDVSGVGPKTAIAILDGLGAESVLSAIVRGDRASLGSVSGVGKKTAERLILELSDKARKLLAERPSSIGGGAAVSPAIAAGDSAVDNLASKKTPKSKIPAQGASASPIPEGLSGIALTDLWNEAIEALQQLGYKEGEALSAVRAASTSMMEKGEVVSLENLVRHSLRGLATITLSQRSST